MCWESQLYLNSCKASREWSIRILHYSMASARRDHMHVACSPAMRARMSWERTDDMLTGRDVELMEEVRRKESLKIQLCRAERKKV